MQTHKTGNQSGQGQSAKSKGRQKVARLIAVGVGTIGTLVISHRVSAANTNYYWDVGGNISGNATWDTVTSNWNTLQSGNSSTATTWVSGNTSEAVFGNAGGSWTNTTQTIASGTTVSLNEIYFNSSSSFRATDTINGNDTTATINFVGPTPTVNVSTVASDVNTMYINAVIASGGFNVNGGGILFIGGNNTYTGGTILSGNGGTLSLTGGNNSLGTGPLTIDAGTTITTNQGGSGNTSAQSLAISSLTLNGNFSVSTGAQGGILNFGTGPVTLGASSIAINCNAFGYGEIDGNISGVGNSITIQGNQVGAGVNYYNGGFIFKGMNTFTGGVTLNPVGSIYAQAAENVRLDIGNLGNATASGLGTGTLTILPGNGTTPSLGHIDNTSGAAGTLGTNNAQIWNGDFYFDGTYSLNMGTGNVTMGGAGSARTVNTVANTLTIGGNISGSGMGLTKAGAGNLTLTGINTYPGATTVNAGTLNIGGGTASGSLNSSSALVLGGGNLTYTVTGTNTQSFNGTTINVGVSTGNTTATNTIALGAITRNVGGTANFGSTGIITTTSANTGTSILGGWATVNGTDWAVSAGNGTAAGSITALPAGSYTNDIWAPANNTTVTGNETPGSGNVTNSLRFTTAAANTITLSGTNVITTGGILLTSTVGSNTTTITGGTLEGASGQDLVLTENNSGILTISSVIADNGTATGLTRSGNSSTALLQLNAANTYTGVTNNNVGNLYLNNQYALGNSTLYLPAGYPTFSVSVSAHAFTFGGLSGSIGFALNDGTNAVALTVGNNNASTTYSGVLSGNGSLTKIGTGILTLAGANTYTGITYLNAGEIDLGVMENATAGTSGPLGKQLGNATGTIVLNSGYLQYSAFNQTDYSGRFSTAANQQYNADTNGQNVTWATVLSSSGGNLTKIGAGILTLSKANTYTGTTTLGGGEVNLGIAETAGTSGPLGNNTAAGSIILNGGYLQYTTTDKYDYSSRFSTAANQQYNADTNNYNVTWATALTSSAGNLTKIGTGTLTLTNNETYSGITTVSAGTLQLGNNTSGNDGVIAGNIVDNATVSFNIYGNQTYAGVISGSGALAMAGNATTVLTLTGNNTFSGATTVTSGILDLKSSLALGNSSLTMPATSTSLVFDQAVGGNFTLGGLSGTGNITLNDGVHALNLTVGANNGNTSYGGNITGNGTLIKVGTGTLTLTNSGNYLTGGLFINSGTVYASNDSVGNGTITLGNSTGGNANNATLEIAKNNAALANPITVASGSSGTLTLESNESSTAPAFAGNITLNNNVTLINLYGGSTLSFGNITGTGNITIGSTSIGNVTLPASASINPTGSITNNGTGTAGNVTLISGVIGANVTGVIQNSATSQLTLSGNNTYSGNTTVLAGTLDVKASLALQNSTLVDNATTIFDASVTSHAFTFGGLSGSGNLTLNDGANAVALSVGNNSSINAYSGILSGNGTLTKIGTGNLSLSGANTYTGTTTVSAGILYAGVANTLSSNSAVTISGGTLDVSGYANTVNSLSMTSGSLNLGVGNLLTVTNSASLTSGTINVSGNATAGNYTLLSSSALTTGYAQGTLPSGYRVAAAGSALNLIHLAGVTMTADATNNTIVHPGTVTCGVNLQNTAPSGSDPASYSLSGVFNGNSGSLAAQAAAINVQSTYTATVGVNTNIVSIANTGSYGWASTPGNVTITQTANNYANPTITQTGGTSGLSSSGSNPINNYATSYFLNFGNITATSGNLTDNLTLANAVLSAYQDNLGGNFTITSGSGNFSLAGTDTFHGLAADGNSTNALTVGLNEATPGSYAETLTFTPFSENTTGNTTLGNIAVTIDANITPSGPVTLIWNGNNTASWDTTSNNWLGSAHYADGDLVVFADILLGNFTVDLGGVTFYPGAVTVNNSNSAYSIGNGSIGGNATLTKNGTNTLTLTGNNTYSGGTTVNAGTLDVATATNGLLSGSSVANYANLQFDGAQTLGAISGNGTTTVSGTGSLTVGNISQTNLMNNGVVSLSGSGTVATLSDTSGLGSAGNTTVGSTGNLTVTSFAQASLINNGITSIIGTGTIGQLSGTGSLNIGNGSLANTVTLAAAAAPGVLGGIKPTQGLVTIASGSTLDITNNALLLNYGGNGTSPLAAVANAVAFGAGKAGNASSNGAIISSTVNTSAAGKYAVGYADHTEISTVPTGNVEVAYTLAGDANLDGSVDILDYQQMAPHYDEAGTYDWSQGDFNHDGHVDILDYQAMAPNYDTKLTAGTLIGADSLTASTSLTAADLAKPIGGAVAAAELQTSEPSVTSDTNPTDITAAIPEPASLSLLLLGGIPLLGRRRRRS